MSLHVLEFQAHGKSAVAVEKGFSESIFAIGGPAFLDLWLSAKQGSNAHQDLLNCAEEQIRKYVDLILLVNAEMNSTSRPLVLRAREQISALH